MHKHSHQTLALILICRNETARKFSRFFRVAYGKTLDNVCVVVCVFVARRPFFYYEIFRATERIDIRKQQKSTWIRKTQRSIRFSFSLSLCTLTHIQIVHRFVVISVNRGDILSRSLQMMKIQRTKKCFGLH